MAEEKKPIKTEKEFKEKWDELSHYMSLDSRIGDFYRARGVTVGHAGGGVIELSLRMNDGHAAWTILQPVEIVELIHQLAASIGCHIMIKPRDDFSSWRKWREDDTSKVSHNGSIHSGSGWAPHSDIKALDEYRAAKMPPVEKQPGLQPAMMARSNNNEQFVATEKNIKRKRTKRTTTTS